VLGAALTLVIIILLMRRRQSKSTLKPRRAHLNHLQHKSLRAEKTGKIPPSGTFIPATAPQFPNNVETLLPQQADDDTVRKKILMLFDQIEIYVDNYYRDYDKRLTAAQESEISRYGTPYLAVPLARLLETSHRKLVLIKHCLGFYTIKLISSPAGVDSLLPSEVITLLTLPKGQD